MGVSFECLKSPTNAPLTQRITLRQYSKHGLLWPRLDGAYLELILYVLFSGTLVSGCSEDLALMMPLCRDKERSSVVEGTSKMLGLFSDALNQEFTVSEHNSFVSTTLVTFLGTSPHSTEPEPFLVRTMAKYLAFQGSCSLFVYCSLATSNFLHNSNNVSESCHEREG